MEFMMSDGANVINFKDVGLHSLEQVGGKNASLGEMICHLSAQGILVPGGFATTAHAFREFLAQDSLDQKIYAQLSSLDPDDVMKLALVGKQIREWIINTPFTEHFEKDVRSAYTDLVTQVGVPKFSVAVRSSATAED